MADYGAPFHMPRKTPKWWEGARHRAIKDKGYKVRIPNLKDIINVPVWDPLTPEEETAYKKGKRGNISGNRWNQIKDMEDYKRDKYDAMLRNPDPEILQNRSSLMAALDDAEDALSTIGLAAKLIGPFLPAAIGDAIAGPLGWALGAAALLNLANSLLAPEMKPLRTKRDLEKALKHNPFSKEGRAANVHDFIHSGLHAGNLLEAAQVTDNIYGVGVCLGPLMALPETIASGLVRQASGQKVDWEVAKPDWGYWGHAASKALHSLAAIAGDAPYLTDDEYIAVHLAGFASHQFLGAYPEATQQWKDKPKIRHLHFRAPVPTNPITLRIMKDHNDDPIKLANWPQTGTAWADHNTLTKATVPKAKRNLGAWVKKNRHSMKAYYAAMNMGEIPLQAIAGATGPENLATGYSIPSRATFALLNANYTFPKGVSKGQIDGLGHDLDKLQKRKNHENITGLTRIMLKLGKKHGIKFRQFKG